MKLLKTFLLILILLAKPIKAQQPDSILNIQLTEANYTPPLIYKKWWKELKLCSRHYSMPDSVFNNIKWAKVNRRMFYVEKTGPYLAYSFVWDNQIVISIFDILNKQIVQHEMLHFMEYHSGIEGNHATMFKKCNLIPEK